MPIYLFWGEDDFAMQRAIQSLRDRTLDPDWASFNYDKIPPDQPDGIINALNQAMTPPFGLGHRLVWLADTTLCQRCSEEILAELERTLSALPETTVLLLTTPNKPDGRLKSTKLLQKAADIREFSPIPPWKTDQLLQQVTNAAHEIGLKLTPAAAELLAESVGNDTRQLYSELEKLHLHHGSSRQAVDEATVALLVTATQQNSLQLAAAIRQGDTATAIALVADLFARNEHPLQITKTLIGAFRTWLWVKLMMETGEQNQQAIARAADVSNPKRIYFLQQEVRAIALHRLQQSLPLLLELEYGLKQGADDLTWMQSRVIELCQVFQ
ncbi:MAG TPA: DNA polymerase III subunit delta [Synechococcales cyanobacterium M55_K2018_004]|nr:DNA polymerase III subunit delta [Synechococcales cyanobacterium M55_K2018_004]